MAARFGKLVLCRRSLLQDTLDPVRGKTQLDKRDTTVECFAVAGDQTIAKLEPADPFKQNRTALALWQSGGIAEQETCVAEHTIADGIGKFPGIIGARIVEALQHRGDRGPPGMRSEKAVLVGAVGGEQHGEPLAIICFDSASEAGKQIREEACRQHPGTYPKARKKVSTAPCTASSISALPASSARSSTCRRWISPRTNETNCSAASRGSGMDKVPDAIALFRNASICTRWRSGPARQNTSPSPGKRVTSPNMMRCNAMASDDSTSSR